MRKLLINIAAVAVGFSATQASASENSRPGWYAGLGAGVAFLEDADVTAPARATINYKTGGEATVALGYSWPINIRAEAELGYHRNDADSISAGAVSATSNGWLSSYSYMGNLYYDFRNSSSWAPYIGGGIGGATIKPGGGQTDTVFAYQLMAGLSYATSPKTEWNLGYRYFVQGASQFAPIKIDSEASHNVEVGLKYHF